MGVALPTILERPGSVMGRIQARIVKEWDGRESGRIAARPAAMRDVPRTLNRFDALCGRLRLVLAEARAIEDLGLDVSLRDGCHVVGEAGDEEEEEEEESARAGGAAAGLWLQVDLSSVKHHCKCRLEVRIADGYPWAPAEVALRPLLGAPPARLAQTVRGLASGLLPSGTPLVAGAGSFEAAVKSALAALA